VADRYCSNCGHELSEDAQFCSNCGRPVHETAHVPTPEADVPVPPPPLQAEDTAVSPPPQDQGAEPTEWWQTSMGKTLGILAAIVVVLSILASLAGGEESTSQADKPKKQQGAHKAQEQGSGGGQGQEPATEPADPFDNGKFYTFIHKENKSKYGEQLILGVLTGSDSAYQIDNIAREIDYDKSKYDIVTVGVLTREEVTDKQIAEMTRQDESITGFSDEDFKQAGVLVISNSEMAESAYGIPPGEHTYFDSFKEMEQAPSKLAAEKAAEKKAAEQQAAEERAAAKKAAEEAAAKKAAEEAAKSANVGDTVGVGNVEWTVTDAFLTNQLKSSFGTQKQGRFVVIDFTFTNNRDEQVTLDPDLHMVLKDSKGREFGTDPDAYEFMPTDLDIFLEPVNPGVSTDGRVIYPVPADANGFTLKLDDVELLEDKSAMFDLGNIQLRVYEEPSSASATASASAGP
jgi:hypothetical protein